MTLSSFVDQYLLFAQEDEKKSGISAVFTLAQAALESGWGKSKLTTQHNNFFGIKADPNWKGASAVFSTREERRDGTSYYVNAPFRSYSSADKGFNDHSDFFFKNPRYAKALLVKNDPHQFADAIHKAGYATAKNYPVSLKQIIDQINGYLKGGAEPKKKVPDTIPKSS